LKFLASHLNPSCEPRVEPIVLEEKSRSEERAILLFATPSLNDEVTPRRNYWGWFSETVADPNPDIRS
ncbi:MAG: hypothetical protein ACC669_10430, partial [bacterium]